ncbi:MAG TPA: AMP-binding protein [Gemmatimonas sp.]|uniref:AMP-binding protein n=1 Tax=Gemmatimonas sp. TaxID=1962908 RepID=UPI002ED941C1
MTWIGAAPDDVIALIDAETGVSLRYGELRARVEAARHGWLTETQLAHDNGQLIVPALVFLLVRNDIASIVALLSLRAAGFAVVLVDASLDAMVRDSLHDTYRPMFTVSSDATVLADAVPVAGAEALVRTPLADQHALPTIHPELALGLATSGSTGSPKLVRLTEQAVLANARSIAKALDIGPTDRAITCLPLHYAYGLSLLTSHLTAGASLVVTDRSFMDGAFWKAVKQHDVTALAGVPYMYEMLERLGVARAVPPCIRVMTQAGGRLRDESVQRLHTFMQGRGGRFHVMYGQTEATARIAIMPHEWLPARLGSAGCTIPGGTIEIRHLDGSAADDAPVPFGTEGEVWYHGPNVMLGYATTRDELARGDDQHGMLRTGDIGRLDADGCLTITGRVKRIGKLFGVRVDLDAIERQLSTETPTAVIEGDNQLVVFTVLPSGAHDEETVTALVHRLSTQLRVQQRAIVVKAIDALPRTSSGKVDYPALRRTL